jgi:hypothetical protein
MAKSKDTEKITVEVNVNDLGVLSRHHFRMANDEHYRARALTPPGGIEPDVELPDHNGLSAAALVGAAS